MKKEINDIQIRVGIDSDCARIAEIGHVAFRTAFLNERNASDVRRYLAEEYQEESIRKHNEHRDTSFKVAEVNGVMVGFSQLVIEAPPKQKELRSLKMERLYILPEFIGKGIGKALLLDAINMANKRSFDIFWLLVLGSNTHALEFYKAFGMRRFGISPGKFEADAEMDFWMKIDLKT